MQKIMILNQIVSAAGPSLALLLIRAQLTKEATLKEFALPVYETMLE